MATGRVLKKLFAMSALAGALLIAAPAQARDRDHHGHGDRYGHYDRHGGHGWNGHHRYRHHGGHHGGHYGRHWGHHGRHWGHHGGHYGHGGGWGYAPRHYAPPRYHHNYHYYDRGWGRMGYHDDGALIHFLVDYARYD